MLRAFPVRFPFRFCRRASRGVALASASVFLFAELSVCFMDGNAPVLILREFLGVGDGFRLRVEQLDRLFSAREFHLPFSVRPFLSVCRSVFFRSRLFFCHVLSPFLHYNTPRADWQYLFCLLLGEGRLFGREEGNARKEVGKARLRKKEREKSATALKKFITVLEIPKMLCYNILCFRTFLPLPRREAARER